MTTSIAHTAVCRPSRLLSADERGLTSAKIANTSSPMSAARAIQAEIF
jgi:hypothetical protein